MDSEFDHVSENFYTKPFAPPQYSFILCRRKLYNDFRLIHSDDIQSLLHFFSGQYAKTHKALSRAMKEINKIQINDDKSKPNKPCTVRILVENDLKESHCFCLRRRLTMRKLDDFNIKFPETLQAEIDFVQSQQDAEQVIAPVSNKIECVCCLNDSEFESMAQCSDGHLVCKTCLNSYVNEIVYGSGKINLQCLTSDCQMMYPASELRRCLELSLLEKLEERGMSENLNMAGIKDLISCPGCNFTASLSPTSTMFLCRNLECQKAICRRCKTDWNTHAGLSCEELKEKDEIALRTEYEELMTKAKIRTCPNCQTEFVKENGCNKLICRCLTTMCYICRTPSINYSHFCGHPRDPGCPCKHCNACSLWTDPTEDDRKAIEEIRQKAKEKRKLLGFDDQLIGAPQSPQ